mgnify:CR=1 FL=1
MEVSCFKTVELIKEFFKAINLKIEKFFLFGSQARGDNNINSDYDFLIVLNKDLKFREKRKLKTSLNKYLQSNNALLDMDLILKSIDVWEWESNNIGFLSYIVKQEGIEL